jgi:hypothetical protein
MGHHYVPQAYLRAFESERNSGVLWMYDKTTRVGATVPIKVVAQSPDYYEQHVERELSAIEGPAHAALARVIKERRLGTNERDAIAYYIAVLMYRVPRRRRKGEEMIPRVLDDTIRAVQADIETWAATRPADDPLVARRRAEVDEIAAKYRVTPPAEVRDQLRTPWPSEKVFGLIAQKTWRLVLSTKERFVTSDNPAFFFEGFGLGNPASELTFSLSPEIALLADWQGAAYSTVVVSAKPWLVREVNRRIVSGAERFVFAHAPQAWLPKVAKKQHPYLSRIQWNAADTQVR